LLHSLNLQIKKIPLTKLNKIITNKPYMGSSQSTEVTTRAFDPKNIYFDRNGNLRLGNKPFDRAGELKKVMEADVDVDMTEEEKVCNMKLQYQ
jgi:hypothetical protein